MRVRACVCEACVRVRARALVLVYASVWSGSGSGTQRALATCLCHVRTMPYSIPHEKKKVGSGHQNNRKEPSMQGKCPLTDPFKRTHVVVVLHDGPPDR